MKLNATDVLLLSSQLLRAIFDWISFGAQIFIYTWRIAREAECAGCRQGVAGREEKREGASVSGADVAFQADREAGSEGYGQVGPGIRTGDQGGVQRAPGAEVGGRLQRKRGEGWRPLPHAQAPAAGAARALS